MTKFLTVEQPTETAGRGHRRNVYAPRKLDPEAPVTPFEFMAVVGGSILVLYAIASLASGGWPL